ncbi:MAG: hypothetical protein Q8L20_00560 [Gammaproteobacteria bacterium]|nr:hypothetical protein [Gammaproteobacteria bacterium]
MGTYIAGSAVTHCIDGWRYIGKAIHAYLRGDVGATRHLAYYAELRATMAILASEGIGAFNNQHYVIDKNRKCNLISQRHPDPAIGTHQFVWDAFSIWAKSPAAVKTLHRLVVAGDLPLQEWLRHLGGNSSATHTAIAAKWLTQWGVDIAQMIEDRELRNEASYNPSAFVLPNSETSAQAISFVNDLWELAEPRSSARFEHLDKILIRKSIITTLVAVHGKTELGKNDLLGRTIDALLHQVTPSDSPAEEWRKFLLETTSAKKTIIDEAGCKPNPSLPSHNKQMLARAFMLLRVASGSCEMLFKNLPTFESADLRFWWEPINRNAGISDDMDDEFQMIDLWKDVEDAISNIRANNLTQEPSSHFNSWQRDSFSLSLICTTERIGLWGVGL